MNETERDAMPRKGLLPENPVWLLVCGCAILLGYFAVSIALHNFVDPDLDYHSIFSHQPLGVFHRPFDRDFAKYNLLSIIWKMTLLFPATICLTLYVAMRASREMVERLRGRLSAIRPLRAAVVMSLMMLALLFFVSHVLFQRQPVYDDENVYAFQARVLQAGHCSAREPPAKACFQNPYIIVADGVWAGKYSAGHSYLLMLGMVLGSPYLVPMLMGAFVPLLVYLVGRTQYDDKVGLLSAALFLMSPAFVIVSGTLMNHTSSLFCLALFTFTYLRSVSGRSLLYPIIAGLALGGALHIRPQDAVVYGLPFAVWSVVRLVRERRPGELARQALILAGFCVMVGLFLWYNKCITGKYLVTPFEYYGDLYPSQRVVGLPTVAAVSKWIRRTVVTCMKFGRMNLWLFGWPFSLVFVLSLFARGNVRRSDGLFLGVIASIVLFYLWHGAHGLEELGARYYFPMLIPLIFLSAREMIALHAYFEKVTQGTRIRGAVLVPVFVGLSFLLALVTFGAEKALHFRNLSDVVAEPYRLVEQSGITNAVVQIHSRRPSGWVFGHRPPNPDLSDDVIYVRALDPRDLLELMNAMPERSFYWLGYLPDKDELVLDTLSREEVLRDMRQEAEGAYPSREKGNPGSHADREEP